MSKITTIAQAKKLVKSLPKDLQNFYFTCNKCVQHLMKTKNMSHSDAESAVLEIVKENKHYLENGMAKQAAATLEMIFMDKPLESFKLTDLI